MKPLKTQFTSFCNAWLLSAVLLLINVIGFLKNGLDCWWDFGGKINPLEVTFLPGFGIISDSIGISPFLFTIFIPPLLPSIGLSIGLLIRIRQNRKPKVTKEQRLDSPIKEAEEQES